LLTYIGLWAISRPQKISGEVQTIIKDGNY
jgi:hypothetical protein